MKTKLIISLLSIVTLFFVFISTSIAAAPLSARLQQPVGQSGNNNFSLTFVVLSTDPDLPISVQCQKKGPSDASYVSFGSLISLTNGGNTDKCNVGGSEVNQSGNTYYFRVLANGTPSNEVSMYYTNEGPGAPYNYSKSKEACVYKITFRTADDSGKTIRVELYRSENQSFNLDNGSKINSVNIGSSTDGQMTDNVSANCNTNYYYAIRAFDTYGNASGATGDSSITTVNPTTTQQQGAIPVTGGSVLGSETSKEKQGEVLGTESAKPNTSASSESLAKVNQNPITASINWVLTHKKIDLLIIIIITGISYFLYRRKLKN